MAAHSEQLLRHVRNLAPRAETASEAELLDRFVRHHDEDAFAALVARHGPMVLGLCRRVLRDSDAAEDAAQATFLVLARRAATICRPETLAAWLHHTARNLALNHLRAETRRRQRELQSSRPASVTHPDPLDELTVRELLTIFDEEVQRLPERYLLPLLLCCLEGRTQEEAARLLGWTPGSVKGRLERGRARLHVRLVRRGLTLSVALLGLESVRGAGLPAGFVPATLQATARFTGERGAGLTQTVATLAETGLKSVAVQRWTLVLSLLLTLGLLGAGVVAVARQESPPPGPAKKVSEQPAQKQPPRTDRHGDPLPEGVLARLGTVRWRAVGEIEALAYSPDGKTIAAAAREGVCLFSPDGKLTKVLRPAGEVLVFSTDGKRLAFSPDGKRLACWVAVPDHAGGGKRTVQLWEMPAGRMVREFDAEALQWLGWSPVGEPLAVILTKGAVALRDFAAGKDRRFEIENLPLPPRQLYGCEYAPAAKVLAVSDQQRRIHVWDAATGKKRWVLEPKCRYVRRLALSPDGRRLASLALDDKNKKTVQLWDVATGKVAHTLAADQEYLDALAFAPDSKTLATIGWIDIRFFDVTTGRECSRVGRPQEEMTFGATVAFTSDGKTLASTERYSGAIHRWDVASGKLKPAPAGHTHAPNRITFSPDGSRVASGGELDGTIFVWDPRTGAALAKIRRRGWVRSCAFSADGKVLYSSRTDNRLEFVDAVTGRVLHTISATDPERPDTEQSGLDMYLAADRKTLVALSSSHPKKQGGRSEETLLLTGWDVATRKRLFLRRRERFVMWPAVSPDCKVLAAAQGDDRDRKELVFPRPRPVVLEDLASGKPLLTLPQIEGQTRPLAFSPDGRLLATVTFGPVPGGRPGQRGQTLRVWELETLSELLALPTVLNARVAFSLDGRLLAVAAPSSEILVWDLRRGRELTRFRGFNTEVHGLCFSPDSRLLLSGLASTELLVWEVPAGKQGKTKPLDAAGTARAWADLAGEPRKAFAARRALAESPAAAVSLLRERLKPVRPADPARVQRLLAALDSKSFAAREKARKELEELGDSAAAALEKALEEKPSLESRRRILALLQRLRRPVADAETRRGLRALAVLEDIGSPEARKVLELMATGLPAARLTQEAKESLERLAHRHYPGK
jgi:RNA polymerase sigma factor (sigma-70 family)